MHFLHSPIQPYRSRGFSISKVLVGMLAILVLMPVAGLTWNAIQAQASADTAFSWSVLAEFFTGSLLLSGCVAIGVMLAGTLPAWLIAQFEFPGGVGWNGYWCCRSPCLPPHHGLRLCRFPAVLRTFAICPANCSIGKVRSDYWFPDIRSLAGAILILTLALYPYVYVLARVAFLEQPLRFWRPHESRAMAVSQSCCGVALPVARPAIVAGAALAAMEALADFGTVSYFGVPTLTTGIFKAWFGQRKPAAGLAAGSGTADLCGGCGASGTRLAFAREVPPQLRARPTKGAQIHSRKRWLAALICDASMCCWFCVARQLLIRLAYKSNAAIDTAFASLAINSILLALAAALLTVVCAIALAYAARKRAPSCRH